MYKLKEGVELPKQFKIKVKPKQSEALQKHLFSLGYTFGANKDVKFTDKKYLYIWLDKSICTDSFNSKLDFKDNDKPRIKFKDYFEKVEKTSFPEKWCILVTQDNYKELNVYLHRNWKNYNGYRDTWSITFEDGTYFYSESVTVSLCAVLDYKMEGYTLITTEQFRKQFGKLVVHKLECKIENAKLQNRLYYYKKKSDRLRKEKFLMGNEILRYKNDIKTLKSIIADQQKDISAYKDAIKKAITDLDKIILPF